jgi:hypothetical protein
MNHPPQKGGFFYYMATIERPENGNIQKFEVKIRYEDYSRAPHVITRGTDHILKLIYRGTIPGEQISYSIDYIRKNTIPYLSSAYEGSKAVYKNPGEAGIDKIKSEAASHANVIFGLIPEIAQSPFLTKGFAKKGVMEAPESEKEYRGRIGELMYQLRQITEYQKPFQTLETDWPRLRTYWFFRVAGMFPIHIPQYDLEIVEQIKRDALENAQRKRDQVNAMLADIKGLTDL